MRGRSGESGGGGPGQRREHLTRASVIFAVFSVVSAGCLGPGVEPPDNRGAAPIGGAGAGQSGIGGTGGGAAGTAGTAGAGGFMNAGTGGLSPMAGAGGGSGEGGAAGMGAGGFGGMTGMGGAGGAGGLAGGTGGAGAGASGDDAGTPDAGTEPEAPVLECEQGRDTLMLLEAALGGPVPYCIASLPDGALGHSTLALAVTPTDQGDDAATTWPDRKTSADACDEDQAFYVDASLAVPRITLCQALCEAVLETGVENVKLELIYGCDPPE